MTGGAYAESEVGTSWDIIHLVLYISLYINSGIPSIESIPFDFMPLLLTSIMSTPD